MLGKRFSRNVLHVPAEKGLANSGVLTCADFASISIVTGGHLLAFTRATTLGKVIVPVSSATYFACFRCFSATRWIASAIAAHSCAAMYSLPQLISVFFDSICCTDHLTTSVGLSKRHACVSWKSLCGCTVYTVAPVSYTHLTLPTKRIV